MPLNARRNCRAREIVPADPEYPRRLATCHVCEEFEVHGQPCCHRDCINPELAGCINKAIAKFRERLATGDCEKFPIARSLIPEIGLISPAMKPALQIEITNACGHRCSNCTRLTAHAAKPFFMTFDQFKAALASLEGYTGIVGIMGGQVSLHPEFTRFIEYFRDNWHPRESLTNGRRPIADFGEYHAANLSQFVGDRGLWTCLDSGFYKNYELLLETFPYFCLNDQKDQTRHQAFLCGRKELGIPNDTWIALREKCWLGRHWSASVNHLGAFPCELMASRAAIGLPGPKAWPVEPGWWQREPSSPEYQEMLGWCETCSIPLAMPSRIASEEIQDVSPLYAGLLRSVGSQVKMNILDVTALSKTAASGSDPSDPDRYLSEEQKRHRVSAMGHKALCPKRLEVLTVAVDCPELRWTLPRNVEHFDRYVVVTASHDTETQQIVRDAGATLVVSDDCYRNGDAFNKGLMANAGLKALELSDWVLFVDSDIFLPDDFRAKIDRMVLNPGCLYFTKRWSLRGDPADYRGFPGIENLDSFDDQGAMFHPWGYFQAFSPRAKVWQSREIAYPDCFPSAGGMDVWWAYQYPKDKQIPLVVGNDHSFDVVHVPHGPWCQRWNNGGIKTGWSWVGQSDTGIIIPPGYPCWLRRVRIRTLETITEKWDGISLLEADSKQDDIWDYSCKPLER